MHEDEVKLNFYDDAKTVKVNKCALKSIFSGIAVHMYNQY